VFSQGIARGKAEDIKKNRTTIQNQGGRKVAITQLTMEEGKVFRKEQVRLLEAKKQVLAQQAKQRRYAQKTEEVLIQKSFVVSAMILSDQTTYLQCWSTTGGETFTGYSNCNWNHFKGQQNFQDGNIQYAFMLLPGTVPHSESNLEYGEEAIHSAPKELPEILKVGARYLVVSGGENNDTIDFLESIHRRYDLEKRMLIRSFRKREREMEKKKHQLKINPPKPKDVEIRFWRRDK